MRNRPFILLLIGTFAALLAGACARPDAPEQPVPGDGPVTCTLTAGFETDPETRTTLSLNEAGTSASVNWAAGDKFLMICGLSKATFTTSESGPVVSFTTRNSLPASGTCYCVYPADRFVCEDRSISSGRVVIALPSVQTAVAGGVRNGLNLSVAYAKKPGADLSFRNVLSYIRFRLEGEATHQIQSVILEASVNIAGDLTVTNPGGDIALNCNYVWDTEKEAKSSTVRLDGPFTPGQDYFIAIAPVTLNGFDLYFRDAQGRSIRRHSTVSLTCRRSRIYDFGTLALGDDFEAAVNHTETTVRYRQATSGHRAIDLCVISEAFRKEELPRYDSLARRAIDYLFETEPYKAYRDWFNVYIMQVPSAESGATVTNGSGVIRTWHDTYFSARWGTGYSDMKANENRVLGFVARNCPSLLTGARKISEVPILMIINDSRYAAISHLWEDGRGYAMVPYTYFGGESSWNYPALVPNGNEGIEDGYHTRTEEDWADIGRNVGDWRCLALHEFGGHVIGRLSDEYWGNKYNTTPKAIESQSWSVPLGLNVTHDKVSPPWKSALLDRQESLVARDTAYGRVGVFQGADGHIYNRWRSEKISCMIDNRPYFSAWQRILIVRRIRQLAGTSFSLDEFFSQDVTVDPVREQLKASPSVLRQGGRNAPVESEPPAPPVLHHDSEAITLPRR